MVSGALTLQLPAVLHRSTATQNAPYLRRTSGGAFEMRAAKSGHPVQNSD
ncbi:hypothetical protein SAMN04487859_1621, partial [Roseovarius lutimaris]